MSKNYEPFDMSALENGNEDPFMNFLRFIEEVYKGADETFGSDLHTPIGRYVLSIGPDIMHGGWMIILGVKQNKKDLGSAVVDHVETKEEALAAHNNWVKSIIDSPPIILRDIRDGSIVTVGIPEQ